MPGHAAQEPGVFFRLQTDWEQQTMPNPKGNRLMRVIWIAIFAVIAIVCIRGLMA